MPENPRRPNILAAMRRYSERPREDTQAAPLAPGQKPAERPWRESDDQRMVCQYLDAHQLDHDAPFPELWQRSKDQSKARRLLAWARARGFKSGMPDLLIWTPPQGVSGDRWPLGLELKKTGATGKAAQLRPSQKQWRERHRARGKLFHCAVGWKAALEYMRALGYP